MGAARRGVFRRHAPQPQRDVVGAGRGFRGLYRPLFVPSAAGIVRGRRADIQRRRRAEHGVSEGGRGRLSVRLRLGQVFEERGAREAVGGRRRADRPARRHVVPGAGAAAARDDRPRRDAQDRTDGARRHDARGRSSEAGHRVGALPRRGPRAERNNRPHVAVRHGRLDGWREPDREPLRPGPGDSRTGARQRADGARRAARLRLHGGRSPHAARFHPPHHRRPGDLFRGEPLRPAGDRRLFLPLRAPALRPLRAGRMPVPCDGPLAAVLESADGRDRTGALLLRTGWLYLHSDAFRARGLLFRGLSEGCAARPPHRPGGPPHGAALPVAVRRAALPGDRVRR